MPNLSLPDCPSGPGAYVVALSLASPLTVRLGRAAPVSLRAGRYLYCGSAYGPGGIGARLARHFRTHKTIRWHVDQLTSRGDVLGAWAFPGGDECGLVRRLGGLPVPIDGFGASDCTHCRSHLLRWPRLVSRRSIVAALTGDDGVAPVWLAAEASRRSRA
jgi:Uri superfamily endonuclease